MQEKSTKRSRQRDRDRSGWRSRHLQPRTVVLLLVSVIATPMLVMGCRTAWAAGLNPAHSTQGYLGVDIRDVTEETASPLKLKEVRGAEIIRVDHDGPAGKVGLREHDVILTFNGEAVEGQEQLRRKLHEMPAGREITLGISRDGQQVTLRPQMANREEVERLAWQQHLTVPDPSESESAGGAPPPDPGSGPGGRVGGRGFDGGAGSFGFLHGGSEGTHSFLRTMIGAPYTGAMMEPLGQQLAEFFGAKAGSGLLVRSVEANSPAATAGLRAGDVVLRANQVAVISPADWAKTMHENRGKPVALSVLREKREQTLTLTPDPKRRSAVEWPEGPGFAELAGPNADDVVASLRPLDQLDLAWALATVEQPVSPEMEALRRKLEHEFEESAHMQAKLRVLDPQVMGQLQELTGPELAGPELTGPGLGGRDLEGLGAPMDHLRGSFLSDRVLQEQMHRMERELERAMPGHMD